MPPTPTNSTASSDTEHNLDTDYSNLDPDSLTNITRRVKRKFDSCPKDSNSNLVEEIKLLILESNKQQNAKFKSLSVAMESMITQNTEIQKSIEFMSNKYDEVLSKLNTLQQENNEYKAQITSLELKLELQERNSRASCVEIRNIPKTEAEKKETLLSLVKSVGNALEENIHDSEIRDVYRIKTKENIAGSIIVEFTTIAKKENLIKASRTFNKNHKEQPFSTTHIQHKGPRKLIYIAESLTKKAQHLHYLARQFRKTHQYHGCWTSYGKIYLRKEERSAAILIASEADLTKLK